MRASGGVKPPSIPDKVGCEAVKKNLELLNGVESDLCFLRKCGSQGFINLIASLEAGSIAKFTEPDPVSTVRKRWQNAPLKSRSDLRFYATNFFPISDAEPDIFHTACGPPDGRFNRSREVSRRGEEKGRRNAQAAIAIPSMSFLRTIVHCEVTGWAVWPRSQNMLRPRCNAMC